MSSWRKIGRFLALIVSLFLILLVLERFNIRESLQIARRAEISLVLLAFLLYQIAMILRMERWRIALARIGVECERWYLTLLTYAGWAYNVFVPRGGDLAKAGMLRGFRGKPLARALASVIAVRVFDILMVAILATIIAPLALGGLMGIYTSYLRELYTASIAVLLAILVALYAFGKRPEIIDIVARALARRDIERGARDLVESTGKLVLGRSNALVLGLFSLIIWLLEILHPIASAISLGYTQNLLLVSLSSLLAAFLGAALFNPVGIGEIALMSLMLVGTGVPDEIAFSIALLDRSLTTLAVVIEGAIATLIIGIEKD